METRWKKMEYPYERYSISNQGQVRDDKTEKIKKAYPTGGNENRRYYTVSVYRDDIKKYAFVYLHRMVAEHFLPEPPESRYVINHKDNDTSNNSADNLEWLTQKENTQLRRRGISRKSTMNKGLGLMIHILGKRGAPIPRLADAFDLLYFTTYKIVNYQMEYLQVYELIKDEFRVTPDKILPHVKDMEVFERFISEYLDN
jgi:hypothetical protein